MKLQKVEVPNHLPEKKAKEIKEMFQPMLDKMVELEEEANEIFARKQTKKRSADAKKLRLKFVKVRTGTAKIHKGLKEFYLAGGKFVDGFKNTQAFAGKELEQKLKEIEVYYEEEEKRIAAEQERQAKELAAKELAAKDDEIARLKALLAQHEEEPVDNDATTEAPVEEVKKAANGITAEAAKKIIEEKIPTDNKQAWQMLCEDLNDLKFKYVFEGAEDQVLHSKVNAFIDKLINQIWVKAGLPIPENS